MYFKNENFDLILYIPPTESKNLVKNFAIKIAFSLYINISHSLIKNKKTQPQKNLQNKYLKTDNVKDAFIIENVNEIAGKNILLIDDIFDSGETIKEVSKYLFNLGANKIAPLVIAKTVGGDL